ncbi:MAG: MFS transporter [Chloroflexi bacterium HGW-Chloroflexi-1]|nr:MAG: MFS transporter [Chloroflexi bacterium HGW-Chloroflexi-1]
MTPKTFVTAGRWPTTFTSLRYPNCRRWFIGQALSLMGTWMQLVAQGWLVYDLTGSKLALGMISFVGTVPTLFLMLPAGAISDRMPRRRMLLITQTAMMAFALILALLTATRVLQVWHIAALAFGLGIANSFDAPARQALAVDMVEDRRDLQNAIALNATVFNMARVVGPAVGGLVLAALGAAWCFALNGLSFLAVLIALVGMRMPDVVGSSRTERLTDQVKAGLRYTWGSTAIRTVVALVGVSSLFAMSYSVLMPVYAVDVLHVGEAGLGALNAAVGAGALVGSLAVATLSKSTHKGLQLTIGSLIFPLALLAFAFSRSFPLSLVWLGVAGFGFVIQNATSNTLVQSLVSDELRGRVMSVYTLMFSGAAPFSALLAGGLAQTLGPTAAVVIGAGVFLLFALGVFIFVPALRRQEG